MGRDPKLGRREFSFGLRTFWKYCSFFLLLLQSKLYKARNHEKNWGLRTFGSCKCGHKKGKNMKQIQPKNKTKMGPAACASLEYFKYGHCMLSSAPILYSSLFFATNICIIFILVFCKILAFGQVYTLPKWKIRHCLKSVQ